MRLYSINKPDVAIETLINIGNPVNLIRYSAYQKYFLFRKLIEVTSNIKLKRVNNCSRMIQVRELICAHRLYKKRSVSLLKQEKKDSSLIR